MIQSAISAMATQQPTATHVLAITHLSMSNQYACLGSTPQCTRLKGLAIQDSVSQQQVLVRLTTILELLRQTLSIHIPHGLTQLVSQITMMIVASSTEESAASMSVIFVMATVKLAMVQTRTIVSHVQDIAICGINMVLIVHSHVLLESTHGILEIGEANT